MKLLVLRLSALGDVAMTVPVIHSFAQQYPGVEVTVVSKPFAAPLFGRMPANVRFTGVDFRQYKGFGGLFRLFRRLKTEGYDAVADLHDVLRTKLLRGLFSLSGKRVVHIYKGRREKRELTRAQGKRLRPLTSSFVRYAEVFRRLGYPVEVDFRSIYGEGRGEVALFSHVTGTPDSRRWIGIAPFAAHRGKVLPDETVRQLIAEASRHEDWRIFLFGSKAEAERLKVWSQPYGNVMPLVGRLSLNEELSLMSHLAVMVSMDSANMHLASLVGTPVVSVWGATHPYAGFMGWRQEDLGRAVQADLPCRPCSIFGNKPCARGDYPCLASITPGQIIGEVERIIRNS